MTNREKYINNASDEELASKLIELQRRFRSFNWRKTYEELIKWISEEAEETTDEMFERLGYIMDIEYETPTTILYKNIDTVKEIIIDKVSLNFGKRNKNNVPMLITEAEDKAIHKKIKELKKLKEQESMQV